VALTIRPRLFATNHTFCRSFRRYGAVVSSVSERLGSFFHSSTRSTYGLPQNSGLLYSSTCDLGTHSATRITSSTGIPFTILTPTGRGSERVPKTATCLCRAGPTSYLSLLDSKSRCEQRSPWHEPSRNINSAREKRNAWKILTQMTTAGVA
jgi:hypothetical protein